jgi:predicted dehydrogenase
MTGAPIRVAVVGTGAIGRIHARVAAELDGFELAAIVGHSTDSAERLAAESAAGSRPAAFVDLRDALASSVDLVAICTPSGTHAEFARAAIDGGAHVLVEKPLDTSLLRARSLLPVADAAAARGQVVSVISQHRFDPSAARVQTAIADGRLGRITSAIASVSWWRSQSYYDSASWRGTWGGDGGGALMNQGVHSVDLLLWFLGRPREVSAYTGLLAHTGIEVEDTAAAAVSFESGAVAVLHATTSAFPGLGTRLQVMGSRGSAVIDNDELSYFHADGDETTIDPLGLGGGGNQLTGAAPGPAVDPTRSTVGHARQYADVERAIQTGTQPSVTVRDAVDTMVTVQAVYLSAILRRPISFDDVMAGAYDTLLPDAGSARRPRS